MWGGKRWPNKKKKKRRRKEGGGFFSDGFQRRLLVGGHTDELTIWPFWWLPTILAKWEAVEVSPLHSWLMMMILFFLCVFQSCLVNTKFQAQLSYWWQFKWLVPNLEFALIIQSWQWRRLFVSLCLSCLFSLLLFCLPLHTLNDANGWSTSSLSLSNE